MLISFGYTVFDLITAPVLITAPPNFLLYFHSLSPTCQSFFQTFYFIFTYYRHLDDLLAQVVENKFTETPRALIRSNTVYVNFIC